VVACARVKSVATIRHIFISPGHNFFGRHGRAAGEHACTDRRTVKCRAGWGLEGDRFFGYRPDYNGQVTFFAWETYLAVKEQLAVPSLRADAFRRNVIVEGLHLNDLAGVRFTLGDVDFEGIGEAKPCYWMNSAVGAGAEAWLRGRGGLRAKILSDGELRRGTAEFSAHGLLELRQGT
jgi:MOSC domain-containing protein YiiM